MKFASVRELKNSTSALLRKAKSGESVLITSHGKPIAALMGVTEDNIEDFILSSHPDLRSSIDAALEEYREKGGIPIEKVMSGRSGKHGKTSR